MKIVELRLDGLQIKQFDQKMGTCTFALTYFRNNEPGTFEKQCVLEHPEILTESLLREIKNLGKVVLEDTDDLIGSIFVVRLLQEDAVAEKLLHFFSRLQDKITTIKHLHNHQQYMKLYDEIKTKSLHF